MIISPEELADLQIPRRAINIVLMQPYAVLDIENEPFKWKQDAAANQIEAIKRTLVISNGPFVGSSGHAHFTVFPEYSIPGIAGVKAIKEEIEKQSCTNGRIVLGCVDGLGKGEFLTLVDAEGVKVHHKTLACLHDNQWVNCIVTWVKALDGKISSWVQPKLVPARPEKGTECKSMMRGDVVHLFRTKFDDGTYCRFLSVICFDWIGKNSDGEGIDGVLCALDKEWRKKDGEKRELSFVFLPQYNIKPSDPEFMAHTKNFFVKNGDRHPFVDRSNCIVVASNVSAGSSLGKHSTFGCSTLISHPNAGYDRTCCEPTFALSGIDANRRGLGWCIDARLREMGPCIHSVSIRVPQSINAGANDRTFPIESASVYPIDQNQIDPRVPSAPVPAIVKWANDSLDDITPLLPDDFKHNLRSNLEVAHRDIVARLRRADGSSLRKLVFPLASPTIESETAKWIETPGKRKILNIDLWDVKESDCLATVVHAFTFLAVIQPVDLLLRGVHGSITLDGNVFDVIVVSGTERHEDSYDYALKVARVREQGYLMVITKNVGNRPFIQRPVKFTDAATGPTSEPKFTSLRGRIFRIGFQNLDMLVEGSFTTDELRTNLMNEFDRQSKEGN